MGNPTVQVYPSACATSKGSNSQTTAAMAAPKPEDGSMVVRAEVEGLNRVKPITVCPNQEVGAPVKELIGPLSAAEAKRTKGSSISKTKHTRHPDFTSKIGPYRTGWSKTSVLVIYNPWKRNISSLSSTFWLVCLTTAAMSLAGFLLEPERFISQLTISRVAVVAASMAFSWRQGKEKQHKTSSVHAAYPGHRPRFRFVRYLRLIHNLVVSSLAGCCQSLWGHCPAFWGNFSQAMIPDCKSKK